MMQFCTEQIGKIYKTQWNLLFFSSKLNYGFALFSDFVAQFLIRLSKIK